VLPVIWIGNTIAALSALLFVPRLRRLRVTTVTELLEKRFGLGLRLLPAAVWIVCYALLAGNIIYMTAAGLKPLLGDGASVELAIWCVGGAIVLYCFFSGLLAVVFADVIHAFLIVLGGVTLLPVALGQAGGLQGLADKVPGEMLALWRSEGAWPTWKDAVMLSLLGLPYWCASQYMLQRSFAGRTARASARGFVLAAVMMGPLALCYVLPGICSSAVHTGPAEVPKTEALFLNLLPAGLPAGLSGLFAVAVVAAAASAASALLSSLATLAGHDGFRRIRPYASERAGLRFGRGAILLAGAASLAFAFHVPDLGGFVKANYAVISFFEPPIFVVVAAAVFWRRANAWGAGLALLAGLAFNLYCIREGWAATDRTILAFPVCALAMVWGTFLGGLPDAETRYRVERLFHRMRRPEGHIRAARHDMALGLAGAALAAFVAGAFTEDLMPKPWNVLIMLALGTAVPLASYFSVPLFAGPATDDGRRPGEEEETPPAIEQSWMRPLLGSGWTWLLVFAGAVGLTGWLWLSTCLKACRTRFHGAASAPAEAVEQTSGPRRNTEPLPPAPSSASDLGALSNGRAHPSGPGM
jgi:SSS family solute:Na+ symporter